MISNALQRYLAVGVIGFAAAAGAPAALATLLTLTPQNFSFTASDTVNIPQGTFDASGLFSANATQPTLFAQFDTLGGTRVLNGVNIVVTTAGTTKLSASVSSLCDDESCSASATDMSTFSVGVDAPAGGAVEYALSPASQNAQVTAATNCDANTSTCETVTSSSTLLPSAVLLDFTLQGPVQLANFVGSGMISVIPDIALAGAYNASTDNSTLAASTTWAGTVTVNYDYTSTLPPGVPEPASLLLIGAAAAALGFYRPRRKHSGS